MAEEHPKDASLPTTGATTAVARGVFRITVQIEVAVESLDDDQVKKSLHWYGGRTPDTDPNLAEQVARDRRLLAALLRQPRALRDALLRNVVTGLDDLRPTDDILRDIGGQALTDDHLLAQLAPLLPADDVTFLQSCCEEDLFYDNTNFFQQAFSRTVDTVAIDLVELTTTAGTSASVTSVGGVADASDAGYDDRPGGDGETRP